MVAHQLKVFVSHSHEDDAFCQALVQGLRQAGADVWYDEHNLGSGRLGPTIERELRARTDFVVILSPAALRSKWVEDEARWAYGLLRKDGSRLILPVAASPIDENDIWLFLQDFRRIEAPGSQPLPAEEAVRRMLHALTLTSAHEALTVATPQRAASTQDLLDRAEALWAQKRYDQMLPLARHATQEAPDSFDAWFNLGRALGGLNRLEEAIDADDRALALDPNHATAWNNKGVALRRLRRYEEALIAFDRTLALDPNNASALHNKGLVFADLKRYEEALAAYDASLAIAETANRWKNKAITLRALGRTAEAEQAERRAKELDG